MNWQGTTLSTFYFVVFEGLCLGCFLLHCVTSGWIWKKTDFSSVQPTQMVNTIAPPPGSIQIVQQIIGPNGEIQQIPIQLTSQQLQLIRAQMTGTYFFYLLVAPRTSLTGLQSTMTAFAISLLLGRNAHSCLCPHTHTHTHTHTHAHGVLQTMTNCLWKSIVGVQHPCLQIVCPCRTFDLYWFDPNASWAAYHG